MNDAAMIDAESPQPDGGITSPSEKIVALIDAASPQPVVDAPDSIPDHPQTGGNAPDRRSGSGDDLNRKCAFFPMTELGNAERFIERFGEEVFQCEKVGWYFWDGKRFTPECANDHIARLAQQCARKIQDEAEAIRVSDDDFEIEVGGKTILFSTRLAQWGRASESAKALAAVVKLAGPMVSVKPDDLDRDLMAINVLNGTLRVDKTADGYIRCDTHNPADRITKLAPVEYDPNAPAPKFQAFLDQVQPARDGKKSVQRFLAQWFGLSSTGDTSEQKLTFHWGKGKNGKGTLVKCVLHVLGDYADSVQIESFLDQGRGRSGGQATPDLAKLIGVRFLTTSEPKRGSVMDEGLVKQFTGEDLITARHLNKEFFSFRPQAKLTMQGNFRPKITGTDEGIWRRMILVPWPVQIPTAQIDSHLDLKLYAEASGILNWMLDGLRDWLDYGLVLPDSVKAATAEYRADSDPLGGFLDVCTRSVIGRKVQSTAMHALFCAWAKANGEATWTMKGLANALTERGIPKKKASESWWIDIELTKSVEDFDAALSAAGRGGGGSAGDEWRDYGHDR
jgi:putative DNA primase/helicase